MAGGDLMARAGIFWKLLYPYVWCLDRDLSLLLEPRGSEQRCSREQREAVVAATCVPALEGTQQRPDSPRWQGQSWPARFQGRKNKILRESVSRLGKGRRAGAVAGRPLRGGLHNLFCWRVLLCVMGEPVVSQTQSFGRRNSWEER